MLSYFRFERLPCMHKGTYADDCLVSRVTQHKAFIVATCDKDLKRRIRKVSTNCFHDSFFRTVSSVVEYFVDGNIWSGARGAYHVSVQPSICDWKNARRLWSSQGQSIKPRSFCTWRVLEIYLRSFHSTPFFVACSQPKSCRGEMVKKHSTSKPGGGRTNAIFKIAGAYIGILEIIHGGFFNWRS